MGIGFTQTSIDERGPAGIAGPIPVSEANVAAWINREGSQADNAFPAFSQWVIMPSTQSAKLNRQLKQLQALIAKPLMPTKKKKKQAMTKSQQMACIHSKDTEPEIMLRKELWRCGKLYRLNQKLPGTPDIVFVKEKVAVFVDGCFWHGCEKHYREPKTNIDYWSTKILESAKFSR
jgi:DNA mismatch endonuclease Vsr